MPPRHRRVGAGRALLRALAQIAIRRGCRRLEWHALDWNDLALGFYERLGAARLSAWELHRLTGDALPASPRVSAAGARRRAGRALGNREAPPGAGLLRSRPVSRILSRAVIHLRGLPGPWRVTCERSCLA